MILRACQQSQTHRELLFKHGVDSQHFSITSSYLNRVWVWWIKPELKCEYWTFCYVAPCLQVMSQLICNDLISQSYLKATLVCLGIFPHHKLIKAIVFPPLNLMQGVDIWESNFSHVWGYFSSALSMFLCLHTHCLLCLNSSVFETTGIWLTATEAL